MDVPWAGSTVPAKHDAREDAAGHGRLGTQVDRQLLLHCTRALRILVRFAKKHNIRDRLVLCFTRMRVSRPIGTTHVAQTGIYVLARLRRDGNAEWHRIRCTLPAPGPT